MTMVIDIGNSRIKGALFKEKQLVDSFAVAATPFPEAVLAKYFSEKKPGSLVLSSVNDQTLSLLRPLIEHHKLNYRILDFTQLKLRLEVDEPQELGPDRIANAYGALTRFPLDDCIVIDIGTAMTADLVRKDGAYLGGMIYPGPSLSAQALAHYTSKLPLVEIIKPAAALGKTTQTHIQSGIYYGLLGAVERLIAELRFAMDSPSSVKVIATGGFFSMQKGEAIASIHEDFKELVDLIDPHLTLLGLYEISSR